MSSITTGDRCGSRTRQQHSPATTREHHAKPAGITESAPEPFSVEDDTPSPPGPGAANSFDLVEEILRSGYVDGMMQLPREQASAQIPPASSRAPSRHVCGSSTSPADRRAHRVFPLYLRQVSLHPSRRERVLSLRRAWAVPSQSRGVSGECRPPSDLIR